MDLRLISARCRRCRPTCIAIVAYRNPSRAKATDSDQTFRQPSAQWCPDGAGRQYAVLERYGLVSHGRRRRYRARGTALSKPLAPNDLWCADYKGEFMLADRRYCHPLTTTDFASRYLLGCEALATPKRPSPSPERVLKDFGTARAQHLRRPLPAQPCEGAVSLWAAHRRHGRRDIEHEQGRDHREIRAPAADRTRHRPKRPHRLIAG